MGLFSFLKKSKDETPTAVASRSNPPAVAEPADPLVSARTSDGVGTPAPSAGPAVETPASSGGAPAETPFSPPREWDMDVAALTAPPPPPPDKLHVGPLHPEHTAELQPKIVEVIKTVYDPEIPVDIYELGLIYEIIVDAERRVLINMTLTSPACPSAQQIPSEVRYKVKAIPEVTDAWVEIVWEPPWSKDLMSEAAKLQLGFF